LQVAFQYRLKEDLTEIVKLYYDWGDDYQKAYAWIARNVLRDEAARWEAYDFFYNRTKINKEMTNRLRGPLDEVAAVLAGDMQLLDVGLPAQFDTALQETELIRQAIKRSGFELEEAETIAYNRLRRVEEEAAVIRNSKQTEAERIGNTLEQEKATFLAQIEAETNSYKALQDQVDLTPRNLLNYIWLQSIGSSGTGRIRVDKPRDVQCFADPRQCTSGPNLNGGAASTLAYECAADAGGATECRLVVPGFQLSDSDEVRLADPAGDCDAWTSPGNGLNDNTVAENSATDTRKGFKVGSPTAAGTYTVCYCAWNAQVNGCQVSGAYVDAGTLEVSA